MRGISPTARKYIEGQPSLFRPIVESLVVVAEDAKRSQADFQAADFGGNGDFSFPVTGGCVLAGLESDVLEYLDGTQTEDLVGNQPGGTPYSAVTHYSSGFSAPISGARILVNAALVVAGVDKVSAQLWELVASFEGSGGENTWTLSPMSEAVEMTGLVAGTGVTLSADFTEFGDIGFPRTPLGGLGTDERPSLPTSVLICWTNQAGATVNWRRSNATTSVTVSGHDLRSYNLTNVGSTSEYELPAPTQVANFAIVRRDAVEATITWDVTPLDLGQVPTVAADVFFFADFDLNGGQVVTEVNDGIGGWVVFLSGQSAEDIGLALSQFYDVRATLTPSSDGRSPFLSVMSVSFATALALEYEAEVTGYGTACDPLTCRSEYPTATVVLRRDGVKDFDSISERLVSESKFKNLKFKFWLGHPSVDRSEWVHIDTHTARDYDSGPDGISFQTIAATALLQKDLPAGASGERVDIEYPTNTVLFAWDDIMAKSGFPVGLITGGPTEPEASALIVRTIPATNPRTALEILDGLNLIAGGVLVHSSGSMSFVSLFKPATPNPADEVDLGDYQVLGFDYAFRRRQVSTVIDFGSHLSDESNVYTAAQEFIDSFGAVETDSSLSEFNEAGAWVAAAQFDTIGFVGNRAVLEFPGGVPQIRIKLRTPKPNLELGDPVTIEQDRFLSFDPVLDTGSKGLGKVIGRVTAIHNIEHTEITVWLRGIISSASATEELSVQSLSRTQVTLFAGEDFRPSRWVDDYADVPGMSGLVSVAMTWERWGGAMRGAALVANQTPRLVLPLTLIEGLEIRELAVTAEMDEGVGSTLTVNLRRYPTDGSPGVTLATLAWSDEGRVSKLDALVTPEVIDRDATYTLEAEVDDLDAGETFAIFAAALVMEEFL